MSAPYFEKPEMSVSQFKSFQNCEAQAMAVIKGQYVREKTTALLVGSYVDAYFSGTLQKFQENTPELFTLKGELRAEYRQAEAIVERIKRDNLLMKYLSGEMQMVFEGEIGGVPFRCKVDSFHPDKAIVDLKVMKDFHPIYISGKGTTPFVEAWGYDIQGAVYQELVRQNTGVRLPFFIAAATKEKIPDIGLFGIPQHRLDYCLNLVKELAPHYDAVKKGEIEPKRCERCDYCKATKVLTQILDYREAG